jgi:hypothetical protein
MVRLRQSTTSRIRKTSEVFILVKDSFYINSIYFVSFIHFKYNYLIKLKKKL